VRVGANCRIHSLVYIATQATGLVGKDEDCPTIGNNVFIGPNTTIVGKIEIADDIAIGANSYVSASFTERGITIAGAPARKINTRGSKGLCEYQDYLR
jgi:serine O-acetyltransferase